LGAPPFPADAEAPTGSRASGHRRLFSVGIRTVSSAILIGIVLVSVLAPAGPFVAVMTLFTAVGLWEYFALVTRKGLHTFRWVGLAIGCSLPWITWAAATAPSGAWLQESVALWLLVGALAVCVIQFVRRASHDALSAVAVTVFGILYVAWLFSFLVRLKLLPNGTALVGYVLLVTKLGDMGAYFIGASWGHTPLIPRISPKKTVEGLVGGLAVSFATAWWFRAWLPVPTIPHAIALGALLGGGAQAGDLIESLFKRDCQTKDSGRLVPGLGGMLDVIDSLLFTIPVFYAYVRIMWF